MQSPPGDDPFSALAFTGFKPFTPPEVPNVPAEKTEEQEEEVAQIDNTEKVMKKKRKKVVKGRRRMKMKDMRRPVDMPSVDTVVAEEEDVRTPEGEIDLLLAQDLDVPNVIDGDLEDSVVAEDNSICETRVFANEGEFNASGELRNNAVRYWDFGRYDILDTISLKYRFYR